MANKKFSEFTLKTDPANVDFLVGYDGTDNVRIDPANLGGGGGAGLVSGTGSDSMASDASLTPSGNPAIASGVRSIALGGDSPFGGTNAQCEANSQDAIAIGTSAFASGLNSVSIGNIAKSRSSDITIGNNSGRYTSSGGNNVRIGSSASMFSSTFSVFICNQS